MKRFFIPYLGMILLLYACGGPSNQYVLKVNPQKLNANTLYDEKLAYDVIFDSEEQNVDSLKTRSRILFLEGVDLYKNKHRPAAAVLKFKASILVFPDAKSYYELGNALLDTRSGEASREEALNAYDVAAYLQFQPASRISFKKACLKYQDGEVIGAVWELRSVFENGMFDTVAVLHEPLLRSIATTQEYRSMVTDLLAQQVKGNANGLFGLYRNAFKRDISTFELKPEEVGMESFKESISYDFASFIPEMENTSFGREVSNDYFYVGKVKETEMYTALLYTSVSFYGEEMQPTYTTLAVYDPEGKIISKKMIACQCSAEKIKRCLIDNGNVIVEDYKRNWAKPFTEEDVEENSVSSYDLLARATFSINNDGMIVAEDVPANYNDSTLFVKN